MIWRSRSRPIIRGGRALALALEQQKGIEGVHRRELRGVGSHGCFDLRGQAVARVAGAVGEAAQGAVEQLGFKPLAAFL